MENSRVAGMLDEVGTLIELSEDNAFRARAYHNAARVVEQLPDDVAAMQASGALVKVPGLGKEMRGHIAEILATGRLTMLDELTDSIAPGLITMLRIPGMGPKRIRTLNQQLGVTTLEELAEACRTNRVASISGFGAKSQANILKGIEFLAQQQEYFSYAPARELADVVIAAIRALPQVVRAEVAGSLRRKKEIVHDLDGVASVTDLADRTAVMAAFIALPQVQSVTAHGETKSAVVLTGGMAMDLRVVTDDVYAAALHHFTGSRDHHIALRGLALERGIKINDYGLWRGEERLPIMQESDVYATLGMEYIPPELREERGEIQAAQANALPTLVTEADIQGVLHCHSTWSDGHASIREMAEACRALGYHYIGMCDHSQLAAYAHGLSPADLRRQHAEIDALNAEYGDSFRILKGTECDILKDGRLDFPDDVLAECDFVVASIHSNFNLSEAEETERLIQAINNPYTTIMGHLTGRILLQREGYPVDIPAVIAAAGARGVAIELNANPARFDLDWRWHRQATEHGVPIPICPDAHTPDGLRDITYGVGIARKGWLTSENIPNAWQLERLLTWFKEVRRRGGATA
jgi:DNA polymerase (family 10)